MSIALLFLNAALQRHGLWAANVNISFIKNGYKELRKTEINFFCFFCGLYALSKLLFIIFGRKAPSFWMVGKYAALFILGYLVALPFFMFSGYLALKLFGSKFIVACYAAYLIKVLPDILIHDKADLSTMKKVDIGRFNQTVRTLLIRNNLEESVYEEISPSKDKNAALVGYGRGMRLEIYGDMTEMDEDQLSGILLHEIGHADENSLLKKTVAYVFVILAEMGIMLWMYKIANYKFSNNHISVFTAFLVLAVIYHMVLRQWLLAVYKIVSQRCENMSDLFARNNGYGKPLASALYDIVTEYNEYIRPTAPYTMLRSTHPPLANRVNLLNSS